MGSRAHDEQGCDDKDDGDTDPFEVVKTPATIGPKGPVEALFFDEFQSAYGKFKISRASPDSGHNGEDDPALHTRVVQRIVQDVSITRIKTDQ